MEEEEFTDISNDSLKEFASLIEDLYWKKENNMKEIAALFGTEIYTIQSVMKSFGIKRRSKSEYHKLVFKKNPELRKKMARRQYEIWLGKSEDEKEDLSFKTRIRFSDSEFKNKMICLIKKGLKKKLNNDPEYRKKKILDITKKNKLKIGNNQVLILELLCERCNLSSLEIGKIINMKDKNTAISLLKLHNRGFVSRKKRIVKNKYDLLNGSRNWLFEYNILNAGKRCLKKYLKKEKKRELEEENKKLGLQFEIFNFIKQFYYF